MDSGTQNPKNILRSLLSLSRFNNSISYSINNQSLKKGIKPKMVVTKALKMVAAHEKNASTYGKYWTKEKNRRT